VATHLGTLPMLRPRSQGECRRRTKIAPAPTEGTASVKPIGVAERAAAAESEVARGLDMVPPADTTESERTRDAVPRLDSTTDGYEHELTAPPQGAMGVTWRHKMAPQRVSVHATRRGDSTQMSTSACSRQRHCDSDRPDEKARMSWGSGGIQKMASKCSSHYDCREWAQQSAPGRRGDADGERADCLGGHEHLPAQKEVAVGGGARADKAY
jgi:hypothetical protein